MSEALNPLIEVGFFLERILEPKPTEEFKNADPEKFRGVITPAVFHLHSG